jgi:hypothetical protein
LALEFGFVLAAECLLLRDSVGKEVLVLEDFKQLWITGLDQYLDLLLIGIREQGHQQGLYFHGSGGRDRPDPGPGNR